MKQYLELCEYVLTNGTKKEDRTGTGTFSTFGYQMRFDLNEGFPLLTTKKTAFRLITSELLWFLKGDTNVRTLINEKNPIWDEWAFEQWVKSEEYTGPDMTNFGLRATKDPEFAEVYKEEMNSFKKRVARRYCFSRKNTVILGQFTGNNGVLGLQGRIQSIKSRILIEGIKK